MVRQGGVTIAFAALLAALGGFWGGPKPTDREDAEGRMWLEQERQRREAVLRDLLSRVPLSRLCKAVPGLRPILGDALGADLVAEAEADGDGLEFNVTAESIAEASEKLAKADRNAPSAWNGCAIAAALTAVELQRGIAALGSATKAEQPTSGTADADALRLRIVAAEDFTLDFLARCPEWRLSRRIAALYEGPMRSAVRAVRACRAAQWRSMMGLLWRFRSTVPFVALSSLLSMVLGAFSAMKLHYQASVINLAKDAVVGPAGSGAGRQGTVGETIGAMVITEVITQLAEFGRARLNLKGKGRVVQELKVQLFQALLRQDLDYLEQCDLWQLRSLIGSCGTTVGQVLDFPAVAVEASVRLISALAVLGRQNASLATFLSAAMPLRFVLRKVVDEVARRIEQRSCLPDFRGQINACWSSLVRPASLRTMRAFAREPAEVAHFARFLAAHDKVQEHGQLIYRLQEPVHALLEHGTEIAALWYGGQLALRGELDFGELSSVVLVAQGAFEGALYAQAAFTLVAANALGPLTQMAALLAQQPRIGLDFPSLESMPEPSAVNWSIAFEGVSFEYPQRPGALVLRELSFDAHAGEFLGMLGTTGAGKSTVLALLLRLYEPTAGRILLGGKDLRSYNPLWLRRHIGFVSQDLVLCSRTVRENLVYGCVDGGGLPHAEPSDEEAREALRIAQCEETFFDTASFPNLWHTDVGNDGAELSGGQRQRLAIARAVIKRPRLLVLDEATSALDELSQARLREAIEEMRQRDGMTVLCVAHRLSNLKNADRLVVLAEGRAAEQGAPSELAARRGSVYAEYARAHRESVPGVEATASEEA